MSQFLRFHVPHPLRRMWPRAVIVLATAILVVSGVLALVSAPADAETIVRGMSVADVEVGGLSRHEAASTLRSRIETLRLDIRVNGSRSAIDPNASEDGRQIATFGVDEAVAQAHAVGRSGGPVFGAMQRVRAMLFGDDVPLPVTLDRVALRSAVERSLGTTIHPAVDAGFDIALGDGAPRVTVTEDAQGTIADFGTLLDDAEDRLRELSTAPVVAQLKTDSPQVTSEAAERLVPAAIRALERAPLTLVARDERWTLSRAAVAEWLVPKAEDDILRLGIDRARAETFLSARATAIATEPKDAVFEEKDGKVIQFVPGTDGASIDLDDAIRQIEEHLTAGADPASSTLDLAIVPVPPAITTASSNPYGIKEIIGIGATNFAGSPKNRRHNIAVGAKAVNGTLVRPDEEFSLLKTLGTIDGTTGYLQELVIKENKTIPEYGGGLCQIGSTTFRAVLDSGLPVTERRNHSYRVPYYERDGSGKYIGPGKDATIYDPAPDFKFKNDTGHAILITTEIDGNTLRFVFWGVRDGRTASQTDARVFNVIPPPEKKIVETDELKPGEEKCTEKPHPGSDAVFTYTVVYPDGEEKKVDFFSRYRPWQEICLVGRDPNKPVDPTAPAGKGPISADATGAGGAPPTTP